jgi:predicted heme/steroid binding protein
MKKSLLIASLLVTSSAFAADGKDVGNGGDAVVCRNAKNKITSVQLYDHFEAQAKRQMTLDLGAATLSYEDKIELLLGRIQKLNPNRAKLYRSWWQTFLSEAFFVKGSNLIDIPDTGGGFVPSGCKLEQLAVQQTMRFPGDTRYTVNQDLWDLMDANGKAGLVMHELILREATSDKVGQTNSINTRYLNSIYSTKAFEKLSLKKYFELLNLVQFTEADVQGGIPVRLLDPAPEFYDENIVKSAAPPLNDLYFDFTWNQQTFRAVTYNYSSLKFYPSGMIATEIRIFTNSLKFDFQGKVGIAVSSLDHNYMNIRLHPDGILAYLSAAVFNIDSLNYKGPAGDIVVTHHGKLQELRFKNMEDWPNAPLPLVRFHNRWFPVYAGDFSFDALEVPKYVGQVLVLSDGVNQLKCRQADFNSKDVITACAEGSGFWKGGDGKVWNVLGGADVVFYSRVDFFEDGSLAKFPTKTDIQGTHLKTGDKFKEVKLWQSGTIKTFSDRDQSGTGYVMIRGQWYNVSYAEFAESGAVTELKAFHRGPQELTFSTKTANVHVKTIDDVKFYPQTGYLKKATLSQDQTLLTPQGPKLFYSNRSIEWDEDGFATQAP